MSRPTLAPRFLTPLLAVLPICIPALAEEAPIAFEAASPAEACSLAGKDSDDPLPVLVTLDPAALRDAAVLDPLLGCAAQRHLELMVRLEPPDEWQGAQDPYAAISGWLADLDQFVQAHQGRIRFFQMGRRPEDRFEPEPYAFLVEKAGITLRSIDPDASLVLGSLGQEAGPWLERIQPRRLAPHIRGLALEDPVELGGWISRLRTLFPAQSIWLFSDAGEKVAAKSLSRFHQARAAGVRTFVMSRATSLPDLAGIFWNLYRELPSRFVVDQEPPAVAPLGGQDSGEPASLFFFADPLSAERAVIRTGSWPPVVPAAMDPVSRARAFDLTTGSEIPVHVIPPVSENDAASLALDEPVDSPVLIRFVVTKGLRGEPETVGVTELRELTAEEIIARERAFEAGQERRLDHYQAKATISYHYRAESLNESIDVTSVNRFYWRGGVGEYEETELYINGARWRGKPPSLPFIAAEKVKEVPLEVRLDQSYLYTLRARDRFEGRPAYLIGFEPLDPDRALYSGEVWIDAERFARLKIRLVQHALKEPITSNSDVIEYGPAGEAAPADGFWLPLRGYRQMVFTVLGRAVAVERRAAYEEIAINTPQFEQGREQAYASGRPILRDDETGYSYLVKEADGLRSRRADSLRNVALFGGIGFHTDGSVGSPFAGLNYFDFDWLGTGTQIDIAFAGPLLDVAWTEPGLGASRWELTLEGRVVGIEERFKRVTGKGRIREQDLEALEEHAQVTLARPLTPFQKIEFQTDLGYDNFDHSDETDPNFVLPPTRLVATGTARWKYYRSGYLVDVWFSGGHRFGWDDWGLPDPDAPAGETLLTGGSEGQTDFQRWGLGALKSFYPARLQKISLGGSLFAGRYMDRLSRFRIGDFRNARVRGYNSFDITFERGATAQVNYKFTLPRGGVSLELGVEGAVLENDEDFSGRQYLAGGGAAASFSGPWGTLLSMRAGFGMGSSLQISPGGASIRLLMIKTFDHWPFRRSRRP